MHCFFVTPNQVEEGGCRITGQDVIHIRNVLRMKPGDKIGIRDGISRNYICELEEIGEDQVYARIVSEEKEDSELSSRIWLFQGLPKGDKMDWIVQKAVELGVYGIVPMATRRSVVKLDRKKEEAKLRRWNAIAESAAKQSGRMIVPKVEPVVSFSYGCLQMQKLDVGLIPYELTRGMEETRRTLARIRPGMEIGIMIGPEGGFDVEEVKEAVNAKICPITLGRRILRTETAGMAALAVLMFLLEDS